ncbi:MFS transporter [Deinococcus malanensis]|uniref:MFS transporter n=1 Tax=Deinococcus malanensis TaxID=1706855 RepID=UPI00362B5E88
MSTVQVSLVLGVLGVGRFVAEGLGGTLSDRLGTGATMILALSGGAVMLLGLSTATSFPGVLLGTLLFSLFTALYKPAASSAVAELTSGAQRTRAYNLLYWAINVGASVAPALGGWLSGISFRLLFYLDAATMAVYALLLGLAHRKTRRPARSREHKATLLPRDPLLWSFCLASLLFGMTYQSYKLLALVFAQQGSVPFSTGRPCRSTA